MEPENRAIEVEYTVSYEGGREGWGRGREGGIGKREGGRNGEEGGRGKRVGGERERRVFFKCIILFSPSF